MAALAGFVALVLDRTRRLLTRFAAGTVSVAANARDLRILGVALVICEFTATAPLIVPLITALPPELADHTLRWQPPAWEVLITATVALVVAEVIRVRAGSSRSDTRRASSREGPTKGRATPLDDGSGEAPT